MMDDAGRVESSSYRCRKWKKEAKTEEGRREIKEGGYTNKRETEEIDSSAEKDGC